MGDDNDCGIEIPHKPQHDTCYNPTDYSVRNNDESSYDYRAQTEPAPSSVSKQSVRDNNATGGGGSSMFQCALMDVSSSSSAAARGAGDSPPSRDHRNEQQQPGTTKKRHRRQHPPLQRPFFLEITDTLKLAHSKRHPWELFMDNNANQHYHHHHQQPPAPPPYYDVYQQAYDRPDFNHLAQLTFGLLICTVFTIVAGYDAKQHCLFHETSVVRELADDDNIQHYNNNNKNNNNAASESSASSSYYDDSSLSSESFEKCLLMFNRVLLPTGVGSFFLCTVALILIIRHFRTIRQKEQRLPEHQQQKSEIATSSSSSSSLPPCAKLPTAATHVGWKSSVRTTIALTICFVFILALQTYNISQVMLFEPPLLLNEDEDNDATNDWVNSSSNNNNNNNNVEQQNPYQSLAAVDSFGQVGDNANLYYLTWFCYVLIITLTYQSVTACFRVCRAARQGDDPTALSQSIASGDGGAISDEHHLARAASWTSERTMRKQTRAAWYTSLYKLRTRTGVWTAACVTCVVIVASSQYIWAQVLAPYVARTQVYRHHRGSIGRAIIAIRRNNPVCSAASTLSANYFAPALCRRTMAAWVVGYVAAILCFTAVASHLVARYGGGQSSSDGDDHGLSQAFRHDHYLMELLADREICGTNPTQPWKHTEHLLKRYYSFHHPKRLPLRTELGLAVVLSLLLGVNAVLVTAVKGPAATVGNLYYASWLAFLLCVRICLGCIEEYYNIDDEDNDDESVTAEAGATQSTEVPAKGSYDPTMAANTHKGFFQRNDSPLRITLESSQHNQYNDAAAVAQTIEKKRRGRVRGYFFLAIFSWVCAASAYDAGANQKASLTREQLYMTVAPVVVAVIATLCFFTSLSKPCYSVLRRFLVGGVLAVLCCGIWLGNLILTMHSENSWAVNGIGEIKMANLYYFSWASMITSGISMTSYVKGLLSIKKIDHMSTVWVVICKVCFVILGAALHVWHTISDNCEFDEITSGAVTFCSRTVLAICVALTGLFVSGLVVTIRFFVSVSPCCDCGRLQAHAEMLVSLFLTLLFVAAVAMITCIGGPGQSVGDLYYSTWLAFWVSLGVFVSCLKQLQDEDSEMETTSVTM